MFRQPSTEHAAAAAADTAPPWHILIVDDEPIVHTMTRLALGEMRFDGRGQVFHYATSVAAAREVIERVPEIAVAFIDVVMETDRAGLDLVTHIRQERADSLMRIILRTGQPGVTSEQAALTDHDINAYLDKAATDAGRLYAALLTALRSHNEISRLHDTVRRIEAMAAVDPLTGLQNVRNLRPALARAIGGAKRRNEAMSLVFIDVDDFKRINDEQGHLRGDEVLRAVGAAIASHSRTDDSCFRYGGDEFLVLLSLCTAEQARTQYCRRLNAELARIGVRASLGIAQTGPDHYDTIDDLLARADRDMYAQKRARVTRQRRARR